MALDAMDRRMIELAQRRGHVLVAMPTGGEVQAVLLCWRATGQGHLRARVQFLNGRQRTVGTWAVRPLPSCTP